MRKGYNSLAFAKYSSILLRQGGVVGNLPAATPTSTLTITPTVTPTPTITPTST